MRKDTLQAFEDLGATITEHADDEITIDFTSTNLDPVLMQDRWFQSIAAQGTPLTAKWHITIKDETQIDSIIKIAYKHGLFLIPIDDTQYRILARADSRFINLIIDPNEWTVTSLQIKEGYCWLLTKDDQRFTTNGIAYPSPAEAEIAAMGFMQARTIDPTN